MEEAAVSAADVGAEAFVEGVEGIGVDIEVVDVVDITLTTSRYRP